MNLAKESGRDPVELIGIAISIFATAVENIEMMHPPQTKRQPKKLFRPKPVTPLGATVRSIIRKVERNVP
jgi:hypothetical protein